MRIPAANRRCTPNHRGVVTVEVALIMPVFVLFLFAIMEFGHFCLVSHTLSAAARRGAHLGSFEGVTNSEVENKVKQIVGSVIDSTKATVHVRSAGAFDDAGFNAASINYASLPAIDLSAAEMGDCFIVRVTVPYDNVSLLPTFFVKGKTIVGQAATRHE